MGVPVARTTISIYALSGFLAGLAGVVFSLYTSAGYSLAKAQSENFPKDGPLNLLVGVNAPGQTWSEQRAAEGGNAQFAGTQPVAEGAEQGAQPVFQHAPGVVTLVQQAADQLRPRILGLLTFGHLLRRQQHA